MAEAACIHRLEVEVVVEAEAACIHRPEAVVVAEAVCIRRPEAAEVEEAAMAHFRLAEAGARPTSSPPRNCE